jgi:hypothetical protein
MAEQIHVKSVAAPAESSAPSVPTTRRPAQKGVAAMTDGRPSPRRRRNVLAELGQGLRLVARPNPLVLLWRWRYEAAIIAGIPAGIIFVVTRLSPAWSVASLAVTAAMIASWPAARSWLLTHARCVVTAHRVRTGCAQAWIHSRYGKLPIILLTTPKPFGERVHLWCRAGTCLEDFESASAILRAACWARDVRVTGSARYSHIVILDVIHQRVP